MMSNQRDAFIPLDPEELDWTKDKDSVNLVLRGQCATLHMEFVHNSTDRRYKLEHWDVRSEMFGGSSARKKTHSFAASGVEFGDNEYFSCEFMITFYDISPMWKSGHVSPHTITLEFHHLEIEVDGDPRLISDGKFSKQRVDCRDSRQSRHHDL